jgi:lipopolysaccharide biosynthesis glycosyltransferase
MSGNKKKLAFLIISSGQPYAAGNVVLGINKYMPADVEYDILVYYNSFSEADITAFQKIPRVTLNNFYLPDDFVKELTLKLDGKNRFNNLAGLMTFSHFEIFALLEKYQKVIWLDTDMSIQSDLSELVNFSGFTVTDDGDFTVGSQFKSDTKIVDYDMDRPAVCAALIVTDDSLPYDDLYKWCYSKSIEYADYLINNDQAIINLALQEFEIIPNIIPSSVWQCTTLRPMVHTAKIAHFGWREKPWLYSAIIWYFPEWYRMHLEWLNLGGSDFPKRATMDLSNKLSYDEILYEQKKYFVPIHKKEYNTKKIVKKAIKSMLRLILKVLKRITPVSLKKKVRAYLVECNLWTICKKIK